MKKVLPLLGLSTIFLVGILVVLYPSYANWLYEKNSSLMIQQYDELVEQGPTYNKEEQLALARAYNDALTGYNIEDPFIPGSGVVLPDNYTSVLNIGGMIGYISIPKIRVELPIRHGTADETLEIGTGHIEATAFPIGGLGNHPVITGHRGITRAKLFTDMDKVQIGDLFLIKVLEDTLVYQVDQILVVEPNDVEALRPVPGKDLVTLVTCTPLGINSHRMLVRGERIPYTLDEIPEEMMALLEMKPEFWTTQTYIIFLFVVLWIVFIALYLTWGYRQRKKKYTD